MRSKDVKSHFQFFFDQCSLSALPIANERWGNFRSIRYYSATLNVVAATMPSLTSAMKRA